MAQNQPNSRAQRRKQPMRKAKKAFALPRFVSNGLGVPPGVPANPLPGPAAQLGNFGGGPVPQPGIFNFGGGPAAQPGMYVFGGGPAALPGNFGGGPALQPGNVGGPAPQPGNFIFGGGPAHQPGNFGGLAPQPHAGHFGGPAPQPAYVGVAPAPTNAAATEIPGTKRKRNGDSSGNEGENANKKAKTSKLATASTNKEPSVGGGQIAAACDDDDEWLKWDNPPRGTNIDPNRIPMNHPDNSWLGQNDVRAVQGLGPEGRLTFQGEEWTNGIYYAGGGCGQAFVFFKLDQWGVIVDRIIVKTCHVDAYEWAHASSWVGNVKDPMRRKHVEVKAMENILGMPGSDRCVRLRGSDMRADNTMYRIYMDFCPHGDPNDLVRAYNDGLSHLPEPVLWHFFLSLAEAALCISYGAIEKDRLEPDFKTIIHRDIKPGNIYLDVPDPKHFPSYPSIRLGDFGLSVLTDADDPMNPLGYATGTGTPNWMPPEQLRFVDVHSLRPKAIKLGPWTNTWAIGAVMLRLMNHEVVPTGPAYLDPDDFAPVEGHRAKNGYSLYLLQLVRQCVQYWPGRRINLFELRRGILEMIREDGPNLARDMRTTKLPGLPDLGNFAERRLLYREAHYRPGFTLEFEQEMAARSRHNGLL